MTESPIPPNDFPKKVAEACKDLREYVERKESWDKQVREELASGIEAIARRNKPD